MAAVERGARSETGLDIRVVAPLQAGPDDVLAAQAIILGTTENLGYMSGALKDFFDRSFYPSEARTAGLPYGLFVSAGNDGRGTIAAVERIRCSVCSSSCPAVCSTCDRSGMT